MAGGGTNNTPISTKTANYTVTTADNGTAFNNAGAAGDVTFTLPTPAEGMTFKFNDLAENTIYLKPPSGVTITSVLSALTITATNALPLLNNVNGDWIELVGASATEYYAIAGTANWDV